MRAIIESLYFIVLCIAYLILPPVLIHFGFNFMQILILISTFLLSFLVGENVYLRLREKYLEDWKRGKQ